VDTVCGVHVVVGMVRFLSAWIHRCGGRLRIG
jgi:hypothetical protein